MAESNSIVAISNPRSGRNKRGGFEKFSQLINEYPEITHIVTSGENELVDALLQCEIQNINILIVNGGDGTLLHVLTFLKSKCHEKFRPLLVLLQSGTTSMAYGDVGCKGRHSHVLNNVVKYANGDRSCLQETPRQVLQMLLPKEKKVVCGMFFGAGVIYNGILYCRQKMHTKGIRGEVGPSVTMIRYLLDWMTANKLTTSSHASIRLDNEKLVSGEFTVITATTLHRLLAGVFPFWGTAKSQACFSLTVIKKNAPRAFGAFIKIIRKQAPMVEKQPNYYQSNSPEKAIIDIKDGFTMDGELFGAEGITTQVVLSAAGEVKFLTT